MNGDRVGKGHAYADCRRCHPGAIDAGAEKLHAARYTHRQGVRKLFLERLSATDQIVLGDVRKRFLTAKPAGDTS